MVGMVDSKWDQIRREIIAISKMLEKFRNLFYHTKMTYTNNKNSSADINDKLPLQLQAIIKEKRTDAIMMAIILSFFSITCLFAKAWFILSLFFIALTVFYIVLSFKLNPKTKPDRKLVKSAAIVTFLLFSGLITVVIAFRFLDLDNKLESFEKNGSKAFISDNDYLSNEPDRKKKKMSSIIIATILLLIFGVAIFYITSEFMKLGSS